MFHVNMFTCALQISIGIWKCWFLRRGENWITRGKTSRSKDENQQQTQPTYDVESGSRTRITLVGGECSHQCAIPAPVSPYGVLLDLLQVTRTDHRGRARSPRAWIKIGAGSQISQTIYLDCVVCNTRKFSARVFDSHLNIAPSPSIFCTCV